MFQVWGWKRFEVRDRMGQVSADKMEEIAAAIAAVVEYEYPHVHRIHFMQQSFQHDKLISASLGDLSMSIQVVSIVPINRKARLMIVSTNPRHFLSSC